MKIPKRKITFRELDTNFDRFPLPIEFDPEMEKRKLWRRKKHIEKIVETFNSMVK